MVHRARRRPSRRQLCHAGLTASSLMLAVPAALAQAVSPPASPASAAGVLQTVTVTAERRTENIKDVPSSVSTLSGEKLDVLTSGGQDIRLLSGRVPSLNIESSFGRAFPRFYIRGYGNPDFRANASQPVSLVYDDVVLESPLLKGFPIFDLSRVEVLAGPQGSLFGRNTPGGVVKLDSVAPEIGAVDGYGSLSYGTFGTANVEAAKSFAFGSAWAARVSMLYQHRDDWVNNTHAPGPTRRTEGYDDRAARIQLLYKPGSDFSALFNAHGRSLDGSARVFRANIIKKGTNDLVDGFEPNEFSTDGRNEQRITSYGGSARLRWIFGDYALNSITGIESVHTYSRGDIDGGYGASFAPPSGPGFIPFPSETAGALHGHRQVTQEFRVESRYAAPLNWQAGVYYFNEKFISDSYGYNSLGGGAQTSLLTDTQKSTSWAAFGSLKYDLTPALSMRAGLRYTKDKKELVSNAAAIPLGSQVNGTSAELSDSKPSGDISVLYKLSPATNVYARIATGYRGSSVQPAGLFGPQSIAGQEDTVSYEAGIKSDLFDKRARVSFNVFHYDVKNLQLTEVGGGGNSNTLKVAKKATGQGFELNLDAYATPNLLLTASASYNATKIKDPNLVVAGCGGGCTVTNPSNGAGSFFIDGNALPNAPKWIATVTGRYAIPTASGGEWFVYTDWSYRSKVNFFLYESVEFTGKAYTEGGLRIGYLWNDGKYEVAAFARNITNKVVATGGIDFNNLTGFINDPRTLGLQFKTQF
ncbi:TonB-dependent receptor [Rhizobacter sp. Root404]|uniref:TonB-dependent receptor n=1 Tax=Rhizobacter sp. Root404 TaxID=1736528 RepID=UPI0009E6C7D6|nr:TonB-dependent receptor [Rhizobacter sp. Root404]